VTARYIIGDTRDVVASLPDGTVDLVMTSPPFLALRSYLPVDHPDKWREIGSEATPAAFLDTLLELTAEWGRVLAPHGSICVELGDTYSGAGGYGNPDSLNPAYSGQKQDGHFEGRTAKRFKRKDDGWPEAKSKALIPELYRIALAYGINPLTGQPSPAGRWRVRNVVTWCRPNPPVGALGDKYRPATSDMVIATRSATRWFDLDAVRGPASPNTHARLAKGAEARSDLPSRQRDGNWSTLPEVDSDPSAGAPPLDYWVIPPGGYTGSHYAVYPPELCRIPIESMCPRQVCTVCGQPRRRIVEQSGEYAEHRERARNVGDGQFNADNAMWTAGMSRPTARGSERVNAEYVTLGWTDCGHDSWRNGIVLDPFGGSGTTGMVAVGLGRDAICIDIDDRNADLAVERIGMFVEVEDVRPVPPPAGAHWYDEASA